MLGGGGSAYSILKITQQQPKKVLLICSHLQQFSEIISSPTAPLPQPDNVNGMRNTAPTKYFPPILFSPSASRIYGEAHFISQPTSRSLKSKAGERSARRHWSNLKAAKGFRSPRYSVCSGASESESAWHLRERVPVVRRFGRAFGECPSGAEVRRRKSIRSAGR